MATLSPSRVEDLESFHRFSLWMIAGPEQALARALAIVRAAPDADFVAWVATLIRALSIAEPRGRGHNDGFVALAERLRLDPELDDELDRPAPADRRRLHVLQWELKQTCLLTAVGALWPTRRGLFVLMHVLARDHALVAEVFETSVAAVRITHARTLRTLGDFLEPRCQHLSPSNPCRCDLGIAAALQRGLIAWPPRRPTPTAAAFDGQSRDLPALYRDLPAVRLETGASAALAAACSSALA
jgi:DNA-directed RNA polymerase specialized sigma24 family protein